MIAGALGGSSLFQVLDDVMFTGPILLSNTKCPWSIVDRSVLGDVMFPEIHVIICRSNFE